MSLLDVTPEVLEEILGKVKMREILIDHHKSQIDYLKQEIIRLEHINKTLKCIPAKGTRAIINGHMDVTFINDEGRFECCAWYGVYDGLNYFIEYTKETIPVTQFEIKPELSKKMKVIMNNPDGINVSF